MIDIDLLMLNFTTTTKWLISFQIFLGCDIPLSGDCVIIPYIQSTVNDGCVNGGNVTGSFCENGPNVIVEAMPYTLSEMDTVLNLEQEISSFVHLQNSELEDENFFDYTNWWTSRNWCNKYKKKKSVHLMCLIRNRKKDL